MQNAPIPLSPVAVAAMCTNGNAVVADIYCPEQRGMASAVYSVPLLMG